MPHNGEERLQLEEGKEWKSKIPVLQSKPQDTARVSIGS